MQQHAQAVAPLGAHALDFIPEFRATRAVNGVENQQVRGQKPGRKNGRLRGIESRRSRIDHQIDLPKRCSRGSGETESSIWFKAQSKLIAVGRVNMSVLSAVRIEASLESSRIARQMP
ncbi:hypothetical protein OAG63_01260 [Methylacidiphilales bacterium]|nr:hypothetical protein [Candidatus Methylacidiphilales bacterium]